MWGPQDGWMDTDKTWLFPLPPCLFPYSAFTPLVNLSVTKLARLRGFPSHKNGSSSSKRQWFSKCVFLLSVAVSKTITCLVSVDGRREGGGGGGGISLLLFFPYNFKYFGGRLDLRSDLADRYALKIDFPKVSQGFCTRTDVQRGRLTFKMIELEVSGIAASQSNKRNTTADAVGSSYLTCVHC